jgi:tryptophan synthase alpha chain
MKHASVKNNRYERRFQNQAALGRKIFIPFTLLGWPTAEKSLDIIETLIHSGASAMELGFPFSDAMADGPIIQNAAQEAIGNGFSTHRGFALIRRARALNPEIPIGLMVYYNTVLSYGIDSFLAEAAEVGADSILIVDLPVEHAEEVAPAAHYHGLDLIFIISPLTSDDRLIRILGYAGGFLYIVSRLGITGPERIWDHELKHTIERVKQASNLPACVGFGISNVEDAKNARAIGADGVITGSRIIQIMKITDGDLEALSEFLKSMIG